jgi:ABC-type maltose transport system permease subunit
MNSNIIGVVVAIIVGFLIALINYFLSKMVLLKAPEKYSLVTVVRQVLQICFLVIVYFIGDKIQEVNTIALLVGAVLGMTLPMICFTKKLLSLNQNLNKKEPGKEDDVNG